MTQAIMETVFDVLYLVGVIVAGARMVAGSQKGSLTQKFGIMAIVLGSGDAFHLIPRMWALWTTGMQANAAALGFGKLVTSLTMTVFYLILYSIWRQRYGVTGRKTLTVSLWSLAILRAALCLLPQNEWFTEPQPLLFGILRNIPFAVMGAIIIVLYAQEAKKANDGIFRWMWLAVLLSFAFYIPVVLFSASVPAVGMLMIPKTLAYAWIVWMGWKLFQQK
ncbi:MAG TPA: hypothetical protein PLP25_06405 [Candidatus Limiplasma sp.]|nr:hypothetical protein [Candidatus Limiplasma sp.]HPS81474.1 hypothetical protein [Candidatus Limiplasma sp.]